ncbi:MAG: DUF2490 domain-containing protein [Candidatus Omnitrophica bacterium]|nr:DUF2490 domain-containing protein [Candidatus Omnitrophota bacterium]
MTRKLKWGMLFLWLAAFNSAASAQIINRENIESKFTLDVPIPELDDFGLEYEHLDRWDGFFNERTQTHNQIFLRYSLPALEKWSVGVGYRRKTTDLQNGGDDKQNRWMLDLSFKKPKLFGTNWDLGFRNRWEFIDSSDVDDTQRVRGRLKLRHDIPYVHIRERPLQFQIYDELYYDLSEAAFSQNSAGMGIVFPILSKAELTLNAEWKNVGSVGDIQESDSTALVSFTFAYALPKDWFADLIGGEVGSRMKSGEPSPPPPGRFDGVLSEIPLEAPLQSPPKRTEGTPPSGGETIQSIDEMPWESN